VLRARSHKLLSANTVLANDVTHIPSAIRSSSCENASSPTRTRSCPACTRCSPACSWCAPSC